jgi:glucose-6-phosphate 1-dehydrogenase
MPTSESESAPAGPSPLGPCALVVFGASGDLTGRKLVPALLNLAVEGVLPEGFRLIGLATRDLTTDAFRRQLTLEAQDHAGEQFDPQAWDRLVQRFTYISGDFRDSDLYRRLGEALEDAAVEAATGGNVLFYLSTPPSFFGEIVRRLGEVGLTREEGGRWRRVVIEKPFGHDLDSARALGREIAAVLDESQIYRIDHYLGKETVQNILVFRFANGIFEPVWNRRYVDHVQITVSEELGVEHRGRYYEEAGALRDMVPSHMFQLVALLAMEPPSSFDAEAVRNEKGKVLSAIQSLSPEDVLRRTVRGQYGPGRARDGAAVVGYRAEPLVSPGSTMETFVAMKIMIDNWRWADVPFYLRTGKRLPRRTTEIAIQFKRVPFSLFRQTPVEHLSPNQLILRLQPEEGISLQFGAKIPGPSVRIGSVNMDFGYETFFGSSSATGYETLLYDAMNGDATLFQRSDSVERAWSVVTPILDVWNALPPREFPNYPAGSWGPPEAEQLTGRDGRRWRSEA